MSWIIFIIIAIVTLISAAAGWVYVRKSSRAVLTFQSIWLFALLVLLGGLLIFLQNTGLEKANAQKNWPKANGAILSSEVTQTRDAWPIVTYEYSIGKKDIPVCQI